MEIDLNSLNTPCLQDLYFKQLDFLRSKLLSGATWQDLHPERMIATELARELYRRSCPIDPPFNPAEYREKNEKKKPS